MADFFPLVFDLNPRNVKSLRLLQNHPQAARCHLCQCLVPMTHSGLNWLTNKKTRKNLIEAGITKVFCDDLNILPLEPYSLGQCSRPLHMFVSKKMVHQHLEGIRAVMLSIISFWQFWSTGHSPIRTLKRPGLRPQPHLNLANFNFRFA